MSTIYINRKDSNGVETVEELTSREWYDRSQPGTKGKWYGPFILNEYRKSDPAGHYYRSQRATKDWNK